MNINTLIKDLDISKKVLFFSVLGQTYYFLIAFFLFKPETINHLDELFLLDLKFYLILFGSFLMSLIWFMMNVCVSVILLLLSYSNYIYSHSPSEVYVKSMICSIGYLTCAMLLTFLLDYDFKHFILYAFTFVSIRILLFLIKSIFTIKS